MTENKSTRADDLLESSAVEDAPVLHGTDTLGDNAPGRQTRNRNTTKMSMFGVLTALFTALLLFDIANGDVPRIILGALVVAVCGALVAGELRKPKRPAHTSPLARSTSSTSGDER